VITESFEPSIVSRSKIRSVITGGACPAIRGIPDQQRRRPARDRCRHLAAFTHGLANH
jgi:hypothetical protein